MKKALFAFVALSLGLTSCKKEESTTQPVVSDYDNASAVKGGILYNTFWATEAGYDLTDTAKINHLNTYSDFYRCKQCHGWDLMGREGSYINRAPKSNRPNVAGSLVALIKSKTRQELFDAIKTGSVTRRTITADLASYNPATNATVGDQMPNYGTLLTDAQIWDLVKFLKEGAFDVTQLYDATYTGTYPTGKATFANIGKDGDGVNGKAFFDNNCAKCHGTNGTLIPNLDGAGYTVGSFVRAKPNEAQHKMKFGQLGTAMKANSSMVLSDVKNLYKALSDTTAFPK